MLSLGVSSTAPGMKPSRRQPSMRRGRPVITWILFLIWFYFVFAAGWVLVGFVDISKGGHSSDWIADIRALQYNPSVLLGFPESAKLPFWSMAMSALLLFAALQGSQALLLHLIELLVLMARDEDDWRRLARRGKSGRAVFKEPPFSAALRSWKNIILLSFKSLLHWLLGRCLTTSFTALSKEGAFISHYVEIRYDRFFLYTLCAGLLAAFATFLAFKRPSGPQPAAWGHVPTLVNLIDDWNTDERGRLWWGDKGVVDGVRHAGTSSKPSELGPIRMKMVYS